MPTDATKMNGLETGVVAWNLARKIKAIIDEMEDQRDFKCTLKIGRTDGNGFVRVTVKGPLAG